MRPTATSAGSLRASSHHPRRRASAASHGVVRSGRTVECPAQVEGAARFAVCQKLLVVQPVKETDQHRHDERGIRRIGECAQQQGELGDLVLDPDARSRDLHGEPAPLQRPRQRGQRLLLAREDQEVAGAALPARDPGGDPLGYGVRLPGRDDLVSHPSFDRHRVLEDALTCGLLARLRDERGEAGLPLVALCREAVRRREPIVSPAARWARRTGSSR